ARRIVIARRRIVDRRRVVARRRIVVARRVVAGDLLGYGGRRQSGDAGSRDRDADARTHHWARSEPALSRHALLPPARCEQVRSKPIKAFIKSATSKRRSSLWKLDSNYAGLN